MGADRQPVPVFLPSALVDELDALVEAGVFSSRSDALRYGARLVVHEERYGRLHERTEADARTEVRERLER